MKSTLALFTLCILLNQIVIAQNQTESNFITIESSYTFPFKTFPIPEFPYIPPVILSQAGDINNDGVMDFYSRIGNFYNHKTRYWYGSTDLALYPNQSEDEFAMPIGDLNGDGINDKIVFQYSEPNRLGQYEGMLMVANQSLVTFNTNSDAHFYTKTLSFEDFDGDGFQDVIVYNFSESGNSEVNIIWGEGDADSIRIEAYDLEQLDGLVRESGSQFFFIDVDNDDNKELISLFQTDADFGRDFGVSIYHINNDQDLELLQVFKVPSLGLDTYTMHAFVNDYDSDGEQDFFISSDNGTFKFDEGNEEGEILEDDDFIDTFRGQPLFYSELLIKIGDFDGNGKTDFLKIPNLRNEYIVEVVELSDSATFINQIPIYEGQRFQNEIRINLNTSISPIDINKDGYNDFTYSFGLQQQDDHVGKRLVLGSSDRNNFEVEEISYESSEFQYVPVANTYNAGDLNGDGIEDFAFLKTPYFFNNELEIYFGGKDLYSNPDLIILSDSSSFINSVVFGDYNKDGQSDILILNNKTESTPSGLLAQDYIHVFDEIGLLNNQPSQIISYKDISGKKASFFGSGFNISHAGDINEDSFSDVFVSLTHQGTSNTYVLFGGLEPFTEEPLVIPFLSDNYSYVGDINQDGTNNFALVNTTYSARENDKYISGLVRIYSTFEGDTSNFDSKNYIDITIPYPNNQNGRNNNFGYFIDSGDLNGDSIPDLLVGSYEQIDSTNTNGVDALFIFYGGQNFSDSSYFSFPFIDYTDPSYSTLFRSSRTKFVAILPDVNDDKMDDILVLTTTFESDNRPNGLIFKGSKADSINYTDPIVLESPYEFGGLGSRSKHVSVGNFNTTSGLDFILKQFGEYTGLSDAVYLFELDASLVSNEIELNKVKTFNLEQNYPNPFNPSTNITFSLPKNSTVTLKVFNILGQEVLELVNEKLVQGTHKFTFDATNLASGVYIYKLVTPEYTESKKMLLIK